MSIDVNGKEADFIEGETVSQLLKRMNFVFPQIVVKIDGRVVPKSDYPNTKIPDNSMVGVIHLISGG